MKKLFLALLLTFVTVFQLSAKEKNWISEKFPENLLKGYKNPIDTESALKGKMVALYFSASWCGPCRNFTPQLIKFYKRVAKKENLEIILVSSDKTDDAMKKYIKKYNMPWMTLPFDAPQRAKLKKEFNVRGIPALIVLDSNGKLITANGRRDISALGNKAVLAWKSKDPTSKVDEDKTDAKKKKSPTKKNKSKKKKNK